MTDDRHPPVALWNPHAIAFWSLLFSPAFGAYLQLHNWRALKQERQAQAALRWFYAGLLVLLLDAVASALAQRVGSEASPAAWINLFLFLLWYAVSARNDAAVIHAVTGSSYPRRPWRLALLTAVLASGAYLLARQLFGALLSVLT
ncbi:MAG: hypothetical protein V4508_10545 [Pseudomonadota bacterium]